MTIDVDPNDDAPSHDQDDEHVSAALRQQLARLRDESRRIVDLPTGEDQVASAERFADDAATVDEALGRAARAEDDRPR